MRWQRQTGAKGTPFILRWAEIVLKCSLMMRLAFFLMTFSFTQFSADVISLMVRMTLILILISTRRWLHRVVWSERLRFPKLVCFSKSQDVFRMQKGSEQRHISFQLRNVNSEQISLKILAVWSWITLWIHLHSYLMLNKILPASWTHFSTLSPAVLTKAPCWSGRGQILWLGDPFGPSNEPEKILSLKLLLHYLVMHSLANWIWLDLTFEILCDFNPIELHNHLVHTSVRRTVIAGAVVPNSAHSLRQ